MAPKTNRIDICPIFAETYIAIMKDGEFKTVARYGYSGATAAHIAEGMLVANGIPAFVFGEVSPYPSLNVSDAIELKVFAKDYDAAMELLNNPVEAEE